MGKNSVSIKFSRLESAALLRINQLTAVPPPYIQS